MDTCLKKFVQNVSYRAQAQLDQVGALTQLNELWSGLPDYDARLTQVQIDSDEQCADAQLTVQQVSDAAYALEQVRQAVLNAVSALTMLAQL